MEKIGIIGSGVVARALAKGLQKHGYSVMVGSGDRAKREEVGKETGSLTGSFLDAVEFAGIVVLAVKGTAGESVVSGLSDRLKGKTVIDTTNPIDDKPPENGVLRFFTSLDESLMERLQRLAPGANFVKAFNSIGNAFMINPVFEAKPTMFICGNDPAAKKEVALATHS
jgi:predicted dinucleotide-binding enzyme